MAGVFTLSDSCTEAAGGLSGRDGALGLPAPQPYNKKADNMQKKRVPVFLVIIAFSISAVRLFGTLHDFGIGAAGNGLPDYCRREALKIASGRSCAR